VEERIRTVICGYRCSYYNFSSGRVGFQTRERGERERGRERE